MMIQSGPEISMRAAPQIGILAVRPMLEALRRSGIDPASILGAVGLGHIGVTDPDARLPIVHLDRIWELAAERIGDPCLGLHVAEAVSIESFGLLSYLGLASATWGDALARVCRNFSLFSDASGYTLEVADGVATVTATQDTPPGGPVRQRVEFTVSVVYCYSRRYVDADWQPAQVFFEHPQPADLTEHRRIYGCTPRFSALRSGFSFAADLLARPMRTSDPALAELLDRLASRLLADAPRATTVAAALRELCIRRGFDTGMNLETLARQLGMSTRTLQRRLREEGTSHHQVLDAARRHVATHMLAGSSLAIAEIAFALGFSEPAALHRAFKRWTGMTPVEYRRRSASRDE